MAGDSDSGHTGGAHWGGGADAQALLDALTDAAAVLDSDGAVIAVNAAWRQAGTSAAARYPATGTDYLTADVARDNREAILAVLAQTLPAYRLDYPLSILSGARHFRMTVAPLRTGRGKALVTHADITQAKQTDAALRIAATAFDSQEGMLITDADSVIVRVNEAFSKITGYSSEEALGKKPNLLNSGRHDVTFYTAMHASIAATGSWAGEIWNRRKNGDIYPEYLTIKAVRDEHDAVTHFVAALTDITVSKAASDEIEHLAFYDPLTRLPNRRLLTDRLKHALAARARGARNGAVMFIDLDNFKILNDTLGHNLGDLLLQQAAQRLAHCIREGDTLARLGGDEFVVVLEGLNAKPLEAAAQTEAVAHHILNTLRDPFQLGDHQCFSSASIGATLFHDALQTPAELLQQADIAMYQAKTHGRNALRFFDQQMQDTINVRATLEDALRVALQERQFALYYQVQVDGEGQPVGAEALIRWIRPGHGMVSPFDFIPVAEESGLILPIGGWVLDTACAQLRAWQDRAATRELVLAVNVSAKQFRQSDFVEQVQAAVHRHAIDPTRLKLELTESILLEHIEDTIATMKQLKHMGIKFSLDDFGTGYSSLQYLKRLPLDQLKIDQSFVRDLAIDSSDRAIVRTIIAMAQSLHLDVIAEGVETGEQRALLANKGCVHYQGYLFSRPVPLAEFEQLLAAS